MCATWARPYRAWAQPSSLVAMLELEQACEAGALVLSVRMLVSDLGSGRLYVWPASLRLLGLWALRSPLVMLVSVRSPDQVCCYGSNAAWFCSSCGLGVLVGSGVER